MKVTNTTILNAAGWYNEYLDAVVMHDEADAALKAYQAGVETGEPRSRTIEEETLEDNMMTCYAWMTRVGEISKDCDRNLANQTWKETQKRNA